MGSRSTSDTGWAHGARRTPDGLTEQSDTGWASRQRWTCQPMRVKRAHRIDSVSSYNVFRLSGYWQALRVSVLQPNSSIDVLPLCRTCIAPNLLNKIPIRFYFVPLLATSFDYESIVQEFALDQWQQCISTCDPVITTSILISMSVGIGMLASCKR
jgi:hypothetical protein